MLISLLSQNVARFANNFAAYLIIVELVYRPVTGQRQTLTNGRSAYFIALTTWSLEESAPAYEFPAIQGSCQFLREFLSTEFAACLKPPSRDNYRHQAISGRVDRASAGKR